MGQKRIKNKKKKNKLERRKQNKKFESTTGKKRTSKNDVAVKRNFKEQSRLDCPDLNFTSINNFRVYGNKIKQAKKMKALPDNTFSKAALAIALATDNGTMCNGKNI